MANDLLVIGDMARSAEMSLSNALGFTKTVNRSYDDRFGRTGAKIGNVANARLPAQFRFSDGLDIDIQALNDAYRPVTLSKNYQRSWSMDRTEAYLSIDEMATRYIRPAMLSMAAEIDRDGRVLANQYTFNTAGTVGSSYTSRDTYADLLIAARERIVENLGPTDEEFYMVASSRFVGDGFKYFGLTTFNPQTVMGTAVTEGKIGASSIAGFKIMEQQALAKYTTGVYGGTPKVNGANQSGATLNTDGWSGSTTLDVGAVFTVDGVFAVNAQTKQSTGVLQEFVVTAKNAAGSTQALQIEPAIVPAGERQNVSGSPADNADITVKGASGVTDDFALAYHPLAFTFANADVTGTEGDPTGAIAEGTAQQRIVLEDLGLSMTMTSAFDIRSNKILVRCDLLGGWAPIYPQLAAKAFF
jgi:hypothetical protein